MRKRLLSLVFAAGACFTASAQQLPNANFDGGWESCYPWEKGAKVKSARGTQPKGWCMANVNGMGGLGATIVGAEGADRSGEDGKKSVIITNTPNPLSAKQVVPGYMSLGTTWATAKATLTGAVTAGTADGGVFGGIALTKRPDALRFYYKRTHDVNSTTKSPTNLTEKASIIAYAWKGTWTQEQVPSNTSTGTPAKVTMTDRSNNILGKECLTGGTITKTDDAELISQIEYYIEGDQADWKLVTIPFEYKNETAIPQKFNVIFSANDIFEEREKMGAGNQLCIDDVELVYYHSLTALSYDGKAIEGFAEDTYAYSLESEKYDASKELTYTKTGIASTVETSYDKNTSLLSICVKGDDGEVTVYTIKFAPEVVGSKNYPETLYVTIDGNTSDPQIADVVVETLNNGNINFTLKNFILGGVMPVGNIALKNIEVAADKTFTFQGGISIEAGDDENYAEEEWLGPWLGEVPLDLTGKFVGENSIEVSIDIDMVEILGQMIIVHLGVDPSTCTCHKHAKMLVNKDAQYGTFCAPFDVIVPEYVVASTATIGDNGQTLTLTELEVDDNLGAPVIPANTPVILFAEEGLEAVNFMGKDVAGDPVAGCLTGVYTKTEAIDGTYILQNNDDKVGFYKVDNTAAGKQLYVGANRAYLTKPESSVKAFYFDQETAIKAIDALTSGKAEIYDMNGRKLNKMQKGINIVNGVKVLVK